MTVSGLNTSVSRQLIQTQDERGSKGQGSIPKPRCELYLSKTYQMTRRFGKALSLPDTGHIFSTSLAWKDLHMLSMSAPRMTERLVVALESKLEGGENGCVRVIESTGWESSHLTIYTNYQGGATVSECMTPFFQRFIVRDLSCICLVHEVIHILHCLELGFDEYCSRFNEADFEGFTSVEERETIGVGAAINGGITENAFRQEMGMPVRVSHWGMDTSEYRQSMEMAYERGELLGFLRQYIVPLDLLPQLPMN